MQKEHELRLAAEPCRIKVGTKRNGKPRYCLEIWRNVTKEGGRIVHIVCLGGHVKRPGTKAAKLA